MKKKVLFASFLLVFLILNLNFASSATNSTTEDDKIDDAYQCLRDKTDSEDCDSLSTEEKVFSLLAVNRCKSELTEDAKDGECWPEANCNIKTTAQAILAFNGNTKAEKWLISQNKSTFNELEWYLQIESQDATTCTISYGGASHSVDIGTDKKISDDAGSCLTLAQDNYWLKISSACYSQEFEVSCDQSFLTNLLFKKTGSPTIHVTDKTNSASSGSSTKEKVNSACFSKGGSCDYEGSLWATLVLSEDYNVDAFIPYLVTMAEDNEKYLPEAFIYGVLGSLGSDYRNELLLKQKSSKWWDESGDKFYDTALALFPLQNEQSQEKTNSKNWLLSIQDANGCWQNNIRNTAFILSSIWPRGSAAGSTTGGDDSDESDCAASGNYCISKLDCSEAGGTELDNSCSGVYVCCSRQKQLNTCSELNGDVCASTQVCVGGRAETEIEDSLTSGQFCCVGGTCQVPSSTTASQCETSGGRCAAFCGSDEEENNAVSCPIAGDLCCVRKTPTTTGKSNTLIIWILGVLILLVILGIIFRNKLRRFFLRFKGGKGKDESKPGERPFGSPPGFGGLTMPSRTLPPRTPPRRLLPHAMRRPPARPLPPPQKKPSKDFDEVLKKLKEMGE